MVSPEYLQQISRKYKVNISENVEGTEGILNTKFITITDNVHRWLSVDLQLVEDELYSVKFFNNDFFEIRTEDLLIVIMQILHGDYSVKKFGLLRRRLAIEVKAEGGVIVPERVYDNRGLENIYKRLPIKFTLRDE